MSFSNSQLVLMTIMIGIVLYAQNTSSSAVLNKCCPVNQHLNYDDFTCVDKSPEWGSKWHPPVENSTSATATSVTPMYGAKPSCDRHYMSELWHDLNIDDFRLQFEMGRIVLEVLSTSTLHEVEIPHKVKFASEYFCVDSTEIPEDATDAVDVTSTEMPEDTTDVVDVTSMEMHEDTTDAVDVTSMKMPEDTTAVVDVTATSGNTLLATPSEVFLVLLCPCTTLPCVRKCCYDGQAITEDGECVNVDKRGSWTPKLGDGPNVDNSYYRLVGRHTVDKDGCSTGLHSVPGSNSSNQSNVVLGERGQIQFVVEGHHVVVQRDNYCVENAVTDAGSNDEAVFYCIHSDTTINVYEQLYGVLSIISTCALLITVALTVVLPDMRKNIHGKMGLCHNCALLVAFITNSIIQLSGSTLSQTTCVWLSFILQVTLLCAFFWLNSMCLEISWVFKSLRPVRNTPESSAKKFNYYALYSFGGSCFIVFVTLIVEFGPVADNNPLKPSFGIAKCFFNHRPAQALFLYGPMSVLLVFNIILFLFTAINILLMRRQASILNTGDSQFTRKNDDLILYVKLFLLMGASWIFEVISWAVEGPKSHWIFTDVINLLRGVFIFVIFCCKKRVYRDLRHKLHVWFGLPLSSDGHSINSSYATARSGLTGTVRSTAGNLEANDTNL